MAQKSIRAQIGADRAAALFWATLVSLPVWAFSLLCVGAAIYVVTSEDSADDRGSALVVASIVLVFAFAVTVLARWTFSAVRAALTPQRIQAMWLRRFQSEGGTAFRTSRIIDRLARHGVSTLTLQDRDVQLSLEQRRNRLAPVFWFLFVPIAALGGVGSWNAWTSVQQQAETWRPDAAGLGEAIGQAIGHALATALILVLIIVVALLAFMAATLIIMALAALAGPIGAMASRNRDDYAKLPQLLRAIMAGKRKGATVLRISDAHWRDAVSTSLKAADAAIIDLTQVTDNIAWEIGEAAAAVGAERIVFICMDTGIQALPQDAVAQVRAALGAAPKNVVFYPASRRREKREGERFARALREAIYAAAERPRPA
ncbi:MAG: hypothetical protein K2P58_07225 [Hyphomonadaceae bacterium]|nr:hypothetical protein [Hyphomonadaceae bacterium]